MRKLENGDFVYIVDDCVYYQQAVKDGKKMIGKITDAYFTGEWCQVLWEDNSTNSYKDHYLIHVPKTLNMTITEMNGFKLGDLVEACQFGSGMGHTQLGKQFTIVEFGSYRGDQGVKLKQDNGEIYENKGFNDFVSINTIRKVSTKEVVTKSYVDAIEPEKVVTFMVDGETLQYQLESNYYNRDGDNNKIFELLGMDEYEKRKFCSEAYGYEEGGGDWPTWKRGDKEAPIKIVKAIREEIQKREKQSSKPNLDGLLAEAKRRYPIGTKYMSLNLYGEPQDEETAERECRWVYDGVRGPVGIDCGFGYVYINDKWAEVVTQKVKSDGIDYDAVLAEAKRRYPIGTKYKPLGEQGNTYLSLSQIAEHECKWVASRHGIDCGIGYVYVNGKWAEVVSEDTMADNNPDIDMWCDSQETLIGSLPKHQTAIILPKKEKKLKIRVI